MRKPEAAAHLRLAAGAGRSPMAIKMPPLQAHLLRPRRAAEDDQVAANRQTASLAGLAMALALVVSGLYLVHRLAAQAAIEDCLMSGRSNCANLVLPYNHGLTLADRFAAPRLGR